MRRLLIPLLFISFSTNAQQQHLVDFNTKRLKFDQSFMITLGSWSLANAAVSAYGWATTENEAKYFHQMNVMWSGINLALAIPGYIKARKTDPSSLTFGQTWRAQNQTERTFMFNSALDVAYITSGFWLRSEAKSDPENYHRFRGWGNGIILQGSFLLVLDITAAIIHSRHHKRQMAPFLDKIEMSDTGIGIKVKL